MKQLTFLVLLMPFLSFGQKLEISEMGGISHEFTESDDARGFTNRVAADYYFCRHFSLGAYYQFGVGYKSTEDPDYSAPASNAFGIAPEFHGGHFFLGLDAGFTKVSAQKDYDHEYITSPSSTVIVVPVIKDAFTFSYGAHLGFKESLTKQIELKEQIGFNYCTITHGKEAYPAGYNNSAIFYQTQPVDQFYMSYYAVVGVSYRFKSM